MVRANKNKVLASYLVLALGAFGYLNRDINIFGKVEGDSRISKITRSAERALEKSVTNTYSTDPDGAKQKVNLIASYMDEIRKDINVCEDRVITAIRLEGQGNYDESIMNLRWALTRLQLAERNLKQSATDGAASKEFVEIMVEIISDLEEDVSVTLARVQQKQASE